MSISLFLEVEAGADLGAVLHALGSIQVEYSDGTGGLHGYLPASNTGFGFSIVDPPEAVVAEGIEAKWQVGLLGSFHFRASGAPGRKYATSSSVTLRRASSGLCSPSSSRASMRQGSGRIWSSRGQLPRNAAQRAGRSLSDPISLHVAIYLLDITPSWVVRIHTCLHSSKVLDRYNNIDP